MFDGNYPFYKTILIILFLYLTSSLALADNCFYPYKTDMIFIAQGQEDANGDICTDRSNSYMTIYSTGRADNNLNSLLSGKNDDGYSLHFTIDRADTELSGNITLFSFYDALSAGNVLATAGINSFGSFYYGHGNIITSSNGVLLNLTASDPSLKCKNHYLI